MRGAETIRRLGWLRALGFAALIAGCEGRPRPAHKPPPRASSSALPLGSLEPPRPAPSMLLPIAEALEEVHEKKAAIAPSRDETPRLAFGKGRLAQAAPQKVVFRDTKDGSVIAEAELGAVRALAAGIDGSLFALGPTNGARLEPKSTKPRTFPHVAFFRGAALFPDLEDPSHFYVYYGGDGELFQFPFEAEAGAFLPIEDRFPLAGCLGAPALTHDGAFLCATEDGVERRAPRGRETHFKWPRGVENVVRLLPAKRLDDFFALTRQGEVVHLRLEQGMPALDRFQLPAPPFAAAANDEALAFVLVSAPADKQTRHFTLLVTGLDGRERFKVELESKPAPPGDDWLEAVIGDKNLAISGFEPLVAVGGPDAVTVWDYAQGAQVFALK
ncbi:MAG TPA: hypothetical protein VHV51_03255 [Polyangiaceae bacterium]|jgi:hypothetical protein|nr:hypothetical protein [Polyangiaceae bacterium]